jgi:hypothetical protein
VLLSPPLMVLAVDVADAAGMQQGGRRGSKEEIR